MGNLLERMFGRRQSSSDVAKERLQLLLVHDRSNLSPGQMAAMKDEILEVIARYVEFDRDLVQIELTNDDRESMLLAEIPIIPGAARKRRPLLDDSDDDDA